MRSVAAWTDKYETRSITDRARPRAFEGPDLQGPVVEALTVLSNDFFYCKSSKST